MDIDFWAARWREGRIGFHEGRTNAFLERHVARLGASGRRVLVPLCGKTEDLAFLAAQGHSVLGVEAVEEAARAFFQEHGLTPQSTERGEHIRELSSGRVTILVGDFFACTPDVAGPVNALWDRGALVALSAADRARYVPRLRELLAPGSKGLVVNCEYDTSTMDPPPHSVPESEVRRLYEGARVEEIEGGIFQTPRMRELGVTALEHCFAIELSDLRELVSCESHDL